MGVRGQKPRPEIQARNLQIVELMKRREGTLRELGERFGVTPERIRQIGVKHGITSQMRRLDADLLEKAIAFYERGMPIKHAAEASGLGGCNLHYHLVMLGIHTPLDDDQPWTDTEVAFLRENYGERGSARRIADTLGRTKNEVVGKANRLGLCKPIPADNMDARIRHAADDGMKSSEIAKKLGISQDHVAGALWRYRNPEKARAKCRDWYAQRGSI